MAYITSLVALATTIGPRMAIVDHPSLVAASPRGCPHDPFHPFGIRIIHDRARSSHSPAAARANAWAHSRPTPARSHRPTARNDPRTARLARPSRRLLASPPRAPSRTSPPAAPPRPPSPSPAPSPRTTSPAPSFHRPRRRARTSPPRLSPRRSRRRPGPRGSDTSYRSRTSRTTAAPGTRAGKSYTRTLRARSRPVIRTAAPARASGALSSRRMCRLRARRHRHLRRAFASSSAHRSRCPRVGRCATVRFIRASRRVASSRRARVAVRRRASFPRGSVSFGSWIQHGTCARIESSRLTGARAPRARRERDAARAIAVDRDSSRARRRAGDARTSTRGARRRARRETRDVSSYPSR